MESLEDRIDVHSGVSQKYAGKVFLIQVRQSIRVLEKVRLLRC